MNSCRSKITASSRELTLASHSTVLNTAIPVATLLFAILLGRERPTPWKLAGIALSLGGALYLLAHSGISLQGGAFTGDLLTLANGLSYGGEGLTNSFMSYATNSSRLRLEYMRYLFMHELMHHWIGIAIENADEERQYWFSFKH